MEKTKQTKETSLKDRFLNTCFITLGMSVCSYFIALISVETFFKPLVFASKDEFFSRRLFFITVLFCIISVIPLILFITQTLLKLITHKSFPIKTIPNISRKAKVAILLCFILLIRISLGSRPGLEIMPVLPLFVMFYLVWTVWIIKKLIDNYSWKWSLVVMMLVLPLSYLFYLTQFRYFHCPSNRPLYERLYGKCYPCDELGYLEPDNCSVCINRYEKNGRCYLK